MYALWYYTNVYAVIIVQELRTTCLPYFATAIKRGVVW